jgi:hypothetical protein
VLTGLDNFTQYLVDAVRQHNPRDGVFVLDFMSGPLVRINPLLPTGYGHWRKTGKVLTTKSDDNLSLDDVVIDPSIYALPDVTILCLDHFFPHLLPNGMPCANKKCQAKHECKLDVTNAARLVPVHSRYQRGKPQYVMTCRYSGAQHDWFAIGSHSVYENLPSSIKHQLDVVCHRAVLRLNTLPSPLPSASLNLLRYSTF